MGRVGTLGMKRRAREWARVSVLLNYSCCSILAFPVWAGGGDGDFVDNRPTGGASALGMYTFFLA